MMPLLFWISLAGIFYTYAGYPVTIWAFSKIAGRRVARRPIAPRVSVVVPCHNEQATIIDRIKNLRASDYPADRLEIIVVSDGSTDGTVEALRSAPAETRVFTYQKRRGKAAALNYAIRLATGDIIVFADARQRFEPRAIRELVATLADDTVGAVTGELILGEQQRSQIGDAQALYWKYEKWIRKNESRFDSSVGATGAIYAIKKELWEPLPESTILDDVYTPMRITLLGYRVVFEGRARAYDQVVATGRQEFLRKARTLTGNYQLCRLMPELLLPTHRLVIQFYSHKLMRLLAPILMAASLTSNVVICIGQEGSGWPMVYESFLAAQTGFYLLVAAGWMLSGHSSLVRLARAAYAFTLMNAAALLGLVYFITGKQDVWTRTE
jgi:cellulose synthase/poly-beta-1,6-N-acetylglucosamine synthase-like glycosyltransferase